MPSAIPPLDGHMLLYLTDWPFRFQNQESSGTLYGCIGSEQAITTVKIKKIFINCDKHSHGKNVKTHQYSQMTRSRRKLVSFTDGGLNKQFAQAEPQTNRKHDWQLQAC